MAFHVRQLLFLSICLLVSQATPAQQYAVIDLGTLGGDQDLYGTWATAINKWGQVVGASPAASGYRHPFLWTPEKGIQDLGTLPNTNYCWANDINDAGHVVGYCDVRAFLWTPETGMVDLQVSEWSVASGLNNHDDVVGATINQAFLDREGTVHFLGAGAARGINDSGQIVGTARWDNDGRQDLVSPEGYGRAEARRINADDRAVGEAFDRDGYSRALLWNNTGVSNLGTFGGRQSSARAINGDLIVGWADTPTRQHALLYDDNGPGYPVDLNDLIPPESGWVLSGAEGINVAGQIVGYGVVNGLRHAFLLTPVESKTSR